jgi:hypothetical protein
LRALAERLTWRLSDIVDGGGGAKGGREDEVKASTKANDARTLDRLLRRVDRRVEARVRRALERLRVGVDLNSLERALELGLGAESVVPWAALNAELTAAFQALDVAYLAGGQLGAAALGEAPFALTNPEAASWAARNAAARVTVVDEATRQGIQAITTRGTLGELSWRDQARLIRPMIGMTEPQMLSTAKLYGGMLADGVPADEALAAIRRRADRLIRERSKCLSGDTRVSAAMVRAVYRRWYDGPVAVLRTASGREFTATPNHPMLTARGWVPAGSLCDADYLVCDARQQDAPARGHQHVNDRPATLAEIFDSLRAVGVSKWQTSRPDFHGDGAHGYVDVLRPRRDLPIGRFTALDQPVVQRLLSPTDATRFRFCHECDRLLSVDERVCFCAGSQEGARSVQAVSHRESRYAQAGRNRAGGQSSAVLLDDGFHGQGEGVGTLATGQARGAYDFRDVWLGDARFSSDFVRREPALIKLDRVASLVFRVWSGHVYNLSTSEGYYNVDGVYTGNTIARTESITAANQGQLDLWRKGQAEGYIPAHSRKMWIVTPDDLLDPNVCRPMRGQERLINEPFLTGDGREVMAPAAHPRCRCALGLVTDVRAIGHVETKYSDDQPRDDRGQWTDGGGDGGDEGDGGNGLEYHGVEVDRFHNAYGGGASTDADRRAAKRSVVHHVGEELAAKGPENMWVFASQMDPADRMQGHLDNTATSRAIAARVIAQGLVDSWAETSGDSNSRAIAVQMVAEREFGIKDAEGFEIDIPGITPAGRQLVLDEARQVGDTHNAVIATALRAMYDKTQADLKKRGITHVTLFRGMARSDVDGDFGEGTGSVQLRPLSSFSSSKATAADFAVHGGESGDMSVMMAVRVPASRILSTARTGLGCLTESEAVILGGKHRAVYVTGRVGPGQETVDEMTQRLDEALKKHTKYTP